MPSGHLTLDEVAQIGQHENTRAERRDASRYVLRHARDQKDLRELLDTLGLNARPEPGVKTPRASVPATTTADAPINTSRRTAS